ncbi:hypothetical protein HKX48_007807 [Thoreauomyces humboldtii]|nr:hypothetical protein HKX48_007807 [Thoreauomyces humboldtii]
MKSYVLSVLDLLQLDARLIDMVLLAIILNVIGSATPTGEPLDMRQSFHEIDATVPGPFLQRMQPSLTSGMWTVEDFSMFLIVMEIAIDRCATYPQLRAKVSQLWQHIVEFTNRHMETPYHDLSPLSAGATLIWNLLQKPDAQKFAEELADTFALRAIKDPSLVTSDDRQSQYQTAKLAMKTLLNARKLLPVGSRGASNMAGIARAISEQYQVGAQEDGNGASTAVTATPSATASAHRALHPRARDIMDRLSSDPAASGDHHPTPTLAGGGHQGTPSRTPFKRPTTSIQYVPVTETKRKLPADMDESVLTPKQLEKRAQVNNVPMRMYNGLDRTQSQLAPDDRPATEPTMMDLTHPHDDNGQDTHNPDNEEEDQHIPHHPEAASAEETPRDREFRRTPHPSKKQRTSLVNDGSSSMHTVPATPASYRTDVSNMSVMSAIGDTPGSHHGGAGGGASFATVLDVLKTKTAELRTMHPRELMRTQISLHNIMGEMIRISYANASTTTASATTPHPGASTTSSSAVFSNLMTPSARSNGHTSADHPTTTTITTSSSSARPFVMLTPAATKDGANGSGNGGTGGAVKSAGRTGDGGRGTGGASRTGTPGSAAVAAEPRPPVTL